MSDNDVFNLLPPLPPNLPPLPVFPLMPAISKEVNTGIAHFLSAPFTAVGQACTSIECAIKNLNQ